MKFPQSKTAKIFLWCCVIAGSMIILVGGWYLTGKLLTYEPTKTARIFIETIGNGDVGGAYQQTAEVFQEATTEEQLQGLTTQFPFLLSLSKIRFTSWSMATGEPAKIGGTLIGSDGTRAHVSVELTKESDGWHVSYMEVVPE